MHLAWHRFLGLGRIHEFNKVTKARPKRHNHLGIGRPRSGKAHELSSFPSIHACFLSALKFLSILNSLVFFTIYGSNSQRYQFPVPVPYSSWVRTHSGLNFFSGFKFRLLKVVYITAMINDIFISFSAVQIYDLSYIHLYSSPSTGSLPTHNVTGCHMAR